MAKVNKSQETEGKRELKREETGNGGKWRRAERKVNSRSRREVKNGKYGGGKRKQEK